VSSPSAGPLPRPHPLAAALAAVLLLAALLGCTVLVQVTPTPGRPTLTPTALTPTPPGATPAGATRPPGTRPPGTPTPATRPSATPSGVAPTPGGPSPSPAASAIPAELALAVDDVRLHPGPQQVSGDVVTVQVIGRRAERVAGGQVEALVTLDDGRGPRELARGPLGGVNLAGEAQAIFERVWDTAGVAGPVTLTVALDPDDRVTVGDENPDNNRIELAVDIRPSSERPGNELGAGWVMTTTDCCAIHYVSGSAAARDIVALAAETQEAVEFVQERLPRPPGERIQIYYIDRVLGHGGFAGGIIVISYLDRNYPAGASFMVVRHEAVHILDRQLSDARTALLAEGLAVYLSGGHFQPEDVDQRAAELVRAGRYIPLDELAADFYPAQHETSYLEGAAFISYLVARDGWERFVTFYRAAGHAQGEPPDQLDAALREVYGAGLEEIEADWLAGLAARPPDAAVARELLGTLRFYDAVRAYQQAYDPTAYFLHAWLPDMAALEARGDVANAVRHPRAPENVALETMLLEAAEALDAREFARAERLLTAVEGVVAARDFSGQPMAGDYLAVVRALAARDYEAQRLRLAPDSQSAEALAMPLPLGPTPVLTPLRVVRRDGDWIVVH
jgi:hypothetical protein